MAYRGSRKSILESPSTEERNLSCGNSRLVAVANFLSCRSVVKGVGFVGTIRGGTPMHILHQQGRRLTLAALLCLICRCILSVTGPSPTIEQQIKNVLLTAKVVNSRQSNKGITNPWRLPLTDVT